MPKQKSGIKSRKVEVTLTTDLLIAGTAFAQARGMSLPETLRRLLSVITKINYRNGSSLAIIRTLEDGSLMIEGRIVDF